MVTEASELSLKYVDAVLGVGKEYLGLNVCFYFIGIMNDCIITKTVIRNILFLWL